MDAATEFDVGPLSWVKSEVDLALERADLALKKFSQSMGISVGGSTSGDLTQLTYCRTHLHQVQGALTMVGLDGVTQVAEAVESLLEELAQGKQQANMASVALIKRSLSAIGDYLDELIDGQPNQPLRLLNTYREVQAARGNDKVSPSDLFFPDLGARLPRREVTPELSPDALKKQLHLERARFQRGLLDWLKAPTEPAGVGEMLSAVRNIEATQLLPSTRAFWWVAGGFLAALGSGGLPVDVAVKQLCARIDLQIRRLLEGSKNVAERLMRDTLYLVAIADSKSATVEQVKEVYRLRSILPGEKSAAPAPLEAARRHLGEVLAAAEESWSKFCAGSGHALPTFRDQAVAICATAERLGHTDLRRLAQATAAVANWLAEEPKRHGEVVAMEIATAIILLQNAEQNFQRLGGDFAHQVDVMVARIHGCIAQNPPSPGAAIPALDEMSRRAQEKLLIGQVAKEIQFNLAQIEAVLDGFFRGDGQAEELQALDAPVRQVIGALTMMAHDDAVAALQQCSRDIKRFAEAGYVPQQGDFEQVAERLSLLGFYVDSLSSGTSTSSDYASFVRSIRKPAPETIRPEEVSLSSVEQEIEQLRRDILSQIDALKQQPDDAGLRAQLKQSLSALQKDADLVADGELVQQTRAALMALDTGGDTIRQIAAAAERFKPQTPAAPAPSAETIQLSQASAEEIDAELLAIFLEEAHEVVGNIDIKLKLLIEQPHNVDALTNLRRSFHTLKGSGRMVGLRELGEVAWSVEQVLNLWLRQELAVSTPVCDLLKMSHAVFSAWIGHLEGSAGAPPDTSRLLALAEALRQGSDSPLESLVSGESAAKPVAHERPGVAQESLLHLSEPTFEAGADLPPAAAASRQTPEIPAIAPVSPVSLTADLFFPEQPFPDESVAAANAVGPSELSNPNIDVLSVDQLALSDWTDPGVEDNAPEPIPVANPVPSGSETRRHGADDKGSAPEPSIVADVPKPVATLSQPRISVSATLNEIFLEEARGHLETLQHEFSALEADASRGTPTEMHRAAHTLGGIAGTVGLMPVNRLGLALEHALLRRLAHGAASADVYTEQVALATIKDAIAELGQMLAVVKERNKPDDAPQLLAALDVLYATPLDVQLAQASEKSDSVTREVAAERQEPSPAKSPVAIETDHPEPAAELRDVADVADVADEFDEQVLPVFLEEAIDLNQKIAAKLRAWRANPADGEAAYTLARLLHTLKGSARMAGAMSLGEITHAIETRVEETRRSGIAPVELIDEIDNAFDAICQIVDRLLRGETLDLPEEHAIIERIEGFKTEASPRSSVAEPAAAVATNTPPIDTVHDGVAEHAMLRVRADLIDRLVNDAGELSIARSRIEGEMRGLKDSLLDLTENVIRLRRQLREVEIQAESQMQSRTAHADERHSDFDPLEFDRFTRFQELTRMMAESVNDVGTVQQILLKSVDEANAAILAQARLNRDLQQELMSVRMVPFNAVSERLYRIVRQTSKELGKRANLDIKGGQLEIDRSVLEKMSAPLEHLLRNAIAHGLEFSETRVERGKPEIGEISLSLTQEGNQIVLSLNDDGAGLDFSGIRTRSIAAGLLAPESPASTATLVDLIFAHGVSTAAEVSQISGRGVGLDVVKTEVTSLGGRIEVTSKAGEGTAFRIYIPLTLALTQALLVRTGSKLYAIPSAMIAQLLDLKEPALMAIRDAKEVDWMGEKYPFAYLPHLLGEPHALAETHRQYWVLLLHSGNQRIAVQIDEPKGNQEIVVKNIGPQLARVAGIDGATVLGDGQVILILNPIALTRHLPAVGFVAAEAPAVEAASAPPALPTVLVVDDSLTVRKFTTRLLTREGYEVITARDGVEALEQLQDIVPHVMLVDIEMPRMDGFELTRNVRSDPRLKDIPIIIITSRTADKHRNYAFEIGVNDYLGKPYREDELLQLLSAYVKPPEPADLGVSE